MSAPDLDAMLRAGRLLELGRALADPALSLDGLERRRLEGELARRKRAPITSLVLAAREHLAAGAPAGPALAAAAAHALGELDLEGLATRMLGELPPPGPEPAPTEDEQAEAAGEEAARARARFDFVLAAERSAEAVSLAPLSDRAQSRALEAALDDWITGDDGALDALRALRDGAEIASSLRAQAREALDAIEAEPDRSPDWILAAPLELAAQSPLSAIAAALGTSIPEVEAPTASHLRAVLSAASVETLRIVLDEAQIEHLLAQPDLLVLLEEERPRRSAFMLLRGFERTARLLLMHDPETGGGRLVPLAEQWRRSTLAGRGALIITGAGERGAERRRALEAAGTNDDPRLALVDRCHFDPSDPEVPFAHVAELAREAIEAAPEIPVSHKRLGEALLELGRLGKLVPEAFELERWVAETRERFPDAEWPHQIYAGALELWARPAEALIAWSDAGLIDPDDERNAFGQVRAGRSAGLRDDGSLLRRALALEPSNAEGWAWLAESELRDGRLAEAEAAAELAAALAPGAPPVVLLQATIAEARDAPEEALTLLETIADAPDQGQLVRLWRRYWAAGHWEALDAQAACLIETYPAASDAWGFYVDTQLGRGEGGRAVEALFEAIQRSDELPADSMSEALIAFVLPEELDPLLREVESLLAGHPAPLVPLNRTLALGGRRAEARASLERLALANPADANVAYNLGRLRLLDGDSEGAGAQFARTIELAENFPWVRYLEGWRRLESDPAAVIEVTAPAVSAAPALFWDLIARALARGGRDEEAAELRSRRQDAARDVLEHADFMHDSALVEPLIELLELTGPAERSAVHRWQLGRAYAAAGRADDALAELLAAYRENPAFGPTLLRCAVTLGRPEPVREHGSAIARETRRRSTSYVAEPWALDAYAAAAAHVSGDPAPRKALLERAERHVSALAALARAGRRFGSDTADEDLARLTAIAPGRPSTLDLPEL